MKFHFIEQEVYLDYINGRKKEIDVLAAVKLNHEDKILHIYTEAQSTHEANFPERMFLYFSYLYAKHRKPIQPIAVLSYNREKEEPTQFRIDPPTQDVLQFNFLQLHLIKKNWKAYIQSDNPAAAALLSQMGYEEHERVQVKLEFLRMITRMQINPAQMMEQMENLPEEEKDMVLQLPNSYFERGKEEGIEEGIEKGKQEIVLKLIKKGMSISEVAEITEYSEAEIKKLAGKQGKEE
ncbi:transposase [Oceanobacillus oncorhynchi]|uniref:transposase n=1 Tax=Oceanobacillus oncorhynchi TaxID=545501 RepID=UPI0025A3A3A4|nr:transposase [Oceanobacillus oncorhynchi]MDM8100778.1 transposase [Oceanobacillus oncorhynchi]